jgi:hypothetical protein
MEAGNEYLAQVMSDQARVEGELGVRKPTAPGGPMKRHRGGRDEEDEEAGTTGSHSSSPAIDFRITGFWRWKTVVVPPNVYVVHTRRGQVEPLHMGLGISFSYNPYTDAFLVIPAAVQTLLISAKCICAERQGVLVQAYVQWMVDDLRTAYRKLDFSDLSDPVRIVNIQLREQAEAAIKDKVAMMSIDDILSDKQPIIEELTLRLREVAEGNREGNSTTGLGLKIVTVQIKEAVVSSTRLWENLQKPFRAQREKEARLAELEAHHAIARLELENRQAHQTAELETTRRLDELRAQVQREAYDREQSERVRRHRLEQETEQQALTERAATEKTRRLAEEDLAVQQHQLEALHIAREQETIARQLELERIRAELERLRLSLLIERENLEHQARLGREEREVVVLGRRRAVENELSEAHVAAQLIARLPEIAAAMPQPEELRAITVGGEGAASLTGLLTGLLGLVDGLLHRNGRNGAGHNGSAG